MADAADSPTPDLSVVGPLSNEPANVHERSRRLSATLDALGCDAEPVLVDDGSRDAPPDPRRAELGQAAHRRASDRGDLDRTAPDRAAVPAASPAPHRKGRA